MTGSHMGFTRRQLLAGAGGLATAAALGACTTTGEPGGPPTTGNDRLELPQHVPNPPVKPDLLPAGPYGLAGYLSFPSAPKPAVPGAPLSGEEISVAAQLYAPAPSPMDRNQWWQRLNQLVGGTIKLDASPGSEYAAKVATLLAGGDLPDLVQIPSALPNRADALTAKFTNLAEHLGGDKISEYTQLANIPAEAWRAAATNGGIYGVPKVLGYVASRWITREDIIAQHGLSSQVSDSEEFFELCKGITDVGKNQWALGSAQLNDYLLEMFGVPNEWRVTDTGWVADLETEEYVAALDYQKRLWDEGVIHPDAFGKINIVDSYKGGRVLIFQAGGNGMVATYNLYREAAPGLDMGMMVAPKADGSGQAAKFLGTGIHTVTGIPADRSPDQVQTLLHVLDKLGGGFGSEEYLAVNFGAEGVHWTFDQKTSSPKPTPAAQGEKLPMNYVPGATTPTYFAAGYPEITKRAVAYEERVFKVDPLLPPTNGLYSPSESNLKARLTSLIVDAIGNVVQGRKPLSEWPAVVTEWRNAGGDTVRAEYEAAAAAEAS